MMQDLQRQYIRRAMMTVLAYDSDYRLSLDMIGAALEATGQNSTYDQLQTEAQWLEEQGYVRRELLPITVISLTDRGLEIARGKAKAYGIRDLRPSEIAEMSQR
ncbi:hypothetical protein [Suttonella indologenes]|uniref:Uncharacterized protein n=1 Tax=Suttonella indologenes TaxID=13276 RepID=A0A380N0K4_9GAMM|nr:hypothetical protein [Suttonella indologenes]SUO97643.1 Uncharacterised protein [Suttonella indologenes]